MNQLKITTAKKASLKTVIYLAAALLVDVYLLILAFQSNSLYNEIMTGVMAVFLIILIIINLRKYIKKEMIKKEHVIKDVDFYEVVQ